MAPDGQLHRRLGERAPRDGKGYFLWCVVHDSEVFLSCNNATLMIFRLRYIRFVRSRGSPPESSIKIEPYEARRARSQRLERGRLPVVVVVVEVEIVVVQKI